jgi:hypothetical protein
MTLFSSASAPAEASVDQESPFVVWNLSWYPEWRTSESFVPNETKTDPRKPTASLSIL